MSSRAALGLALLLAACAEDGTPAGPSKDAGSGNEAGKDASDDVDDASEGPDASDAADAADAGNACPTWLTVCGADCSDLESDPKHCGSCDTACAPGIECNAAQCLTPICADCACAPGSVSFANDVQPLFNQHCSNQGSCHTGYYADADLSFEPGKSYAALVGVVTTDCLGSKTRVVPGNPAESYLVNKLTGAGMCSGVVMPKNALRLPEAEIDKVVAWICGGANDN